MANDVGSGLAYHLPSQFQIPGNGSLHIAVEDQLVALRKFFVRPIDFPTLAIRQFIDEMNRSNYIVKLPLEVCWGNASGNEVCFQAGIKFQRCLSSNAPNVIKIGWQRYRLHAPLA